METPGKVVSRSRPIEAVEVVEHARSDEPFTVVAPPDDEGATDPFRELRRSEFVDEATGAAYADAEALGVAVSPFSADDDVSDEELQRLSEDVGERRKWSSAVVDGFRGVAGLATLHTPKSRWGRIL